MAGRTNARKTTASYYSDSDLVKAGKVDLPINSKNFYLEGENFENKEKEMDPKYPKENKKVRYSQLVRKFL